MAYFIFGVCVLAIAVGWIQYWLLYKLELLEVEIVMAVRSITKPYNDKWLRRFKAMKKSIS